MKALVIDRYGGPEVAQLRELPAPLLGEDDLLIDVHAAGVNPLDFKIRRGELKRVRRHKLPLVLGNELSGVVTKVGPRVKAFKPGDEVFARVDKDRVGAFAEQVAVQEQYVARKPANLSHVEAASIPLVGLTSWQALLERAELKPGQKVLIHAGAGGIGTFAIQLAKQRGAHVATTASARNHELVRKLGADVAIDYTKTDFTEELSDYDVVYDTLGGDTLLQSFSVVKPGGIVVSIAASVPDQPTAIELGMSAPLRFAVRMLNRPVTRAAAEHHVRYRFLFMRPDGSQLAQLADYFVTGRIVPIVDRVFSMAAADEALRYVETGRARGKVIIQVTS
jgi:NADPH:quinone reductase-like Zn-dependent oxidoreductase